MLALEQFGEFDQGDVHLGRNGSQDHFAICFDVARAQIATSRQRFGTPVGAPGADPTNGTRDRNAETLGRSVARHPATIHSGDHTVTKILREGLGHAR